MGWADTRYGGNSLQCSDEKGNSKAGRSLLIGAATELWRRPTVDENPVGRGGPSVAVRQGARRVKVKMESSTSSGPWNGET